MNDFTELNYIYTVSLKDLINYYNYIVIDGISCRFTFDYNSRLGTRTMSIITLNGTVLLDRTPLYPDDELYLNNNAPMIGIQDLLIKLIKIDKNIPDDLLNWSSNYYIYIKGMFDDIYEEYKKFELAKFV